MIVVGVVYVYFQISSQFFGKVVIYIGFNIFVVNGVGVNYLVGVVIFLGDFIDLDGDGYQDLVIFVLGVNGSVGVVYVFSGSKFIFFSFF